MSLKNNLKYINNKEGYAFILVILVFTLVCILGLSLLSLSVNNIKMTSGERDHQSVFYIAEAGAAYKIDEVETKVGHYYQSTDNILDFYNQFEEEIFSADTLNSFESVWGKKPEARIYIEKLNDKNPRKYKITSVGTIGNKSREVEQTITINWSPKGNIPNNMAVFTNSNIILSGGAGIKGNIGTNSTLNHSISFDGGAFISNGIIYVPEEAGSFPVKAPSYMNIPEPQRMDSNTREFEMPPFPAIPSLPLYPNKIYSGYNVIKNGNLNVDDWRVSNYYLNLTYDTSFKEINITQNNTLTINTSSDIKIVVDSLNVVNGHIKIEGTGSLTIYVKDRITMGAGSTINNNGPLQKLNIYLSRASNNSHPKEVHLSGSQKIFGSLYAEDANITLSGGGGFQGHIFTGGKSFVINGGARSISSLIYAPNADFVLGGGGSVLGSIISNTFSASGGAAVIYEQYDIKDLPFAPTGGSVIPEDFLLKGPVKEK